MSAIMVPGEVSAAVVTRRVELLSPLRGRVMQDGLGPVDAMALIDLVRDAILEAIKDDERHRVLLVRVESLRGNMKGSLTALDSMVSEMTGAPNGEDED